RPVRPGRQSLPSPHRGSRPPGSHSDHAAAPTPDPVIANPDHRMQLHPRDAGPVGLYRIRLRECLR
ncbi:MAG: hypothetical protein WA822_16495, partial [Albidovulum sp.]